MEKFQEEENEVLNLESKTRQAKLSDFEEEPENIPSIDDISSIINSEANEANGQLNEKIQQAIEGVSNKETETEDKTESFDRFVGSSEYQKAEEEMRASINNESEEVINEVVERVDSFENEESTNNQKKEINPEDNNRNEGKQDNASENTDIVKEKEESESSKESEKDIEINQIKKEVSDFEERIKQLQKAIEEIKNEKNSREEETISSIIRREAKKKAESVLEILKKKVKEFIVICKKEAAEKISNLSESKNKLFYNLKKRFTDNKIGKKIFDSLGKKEREEINEEERKETRDKEDIEKDFEESEGFEKNIEEKDLEEVDELIYRVKLSGEVLKQMDREKKKPTQSKIDVYKNAYKDYQIKIIEISKKYNMSPFEFKKKINESRFPTISNIKKEVDKELKKTYKS